MTDPNQIQPKQTIAERRAATLAAISDAAKRANRDDDITLIAVSKMQSDDRVAQMLSCGQTVFGENRVQEAQRRWGEVFVDQRAALTLHLIGPLQSNKAEDAVKLFDVIETIDREKILGALVKACQKTEQPMPRLFVQVNTGEEPQKSGVLPADLPAFLKVMRETYGLTPEGLMCIPPAAEAASPHFWFLANLARDNNITKLSMGMSGDFETAVAMGATSVRVGSGLFGSREN